MTNANIEDKEIIYSDLCQAFTEDGITVEIMIYRLEEDDQWSLSIDDEKGGSTVWDDLFPSDINALHEAMKTIREDGIGSFTEDRERQGN